MLWFNCRKWIIWLILTCYCYLLTLLSIKYSFYLVSQREKKKRRLHHIGAPASPPTWRAAPRYRRTHTHAITQSPLPPALLSPFFLSFVVFNFSLSFLCRLWVSLVSSPQGRPAALQIQSDLRHGMTLASQSWLSSGCGLAAAGQWQNLTLVDHEALHRGAQLWIGVSNLALFPFSPRSCSTGIWLTVGGSLSSLGLTS